MSLHKKIKGIWVFGHQEEPSYEGYFQYIYFNDGTMKRFCRVKKTLISYEIGSTPCGNYVESECDIINRPRISTFIIRGV